MLAVDNENATFTSLGPTYERSPWTLSAEYTLRKAAGLVPDTAGWYVMGDYRLGNLPPFVDVSRQTLKRAENNPLAALIGAPGPTGVIAGTLENVLTAVRTEQRTTTLGLRWDIAPDMALKGQVESILKPANSYGSFFRSRADTPKIGPSTSKSAASMCSASRWTSCSEQGGAPLGAELPGVEPRWGSQASQAASAGQTIIWHAERLP